MKLCKEKATFTYRGKTVEVDYYFYCEGDRRYTTKTLDALNYSNIMDAYHKERGCRDE